MTLRRIAETILVLLFAASVLAQGPTPPSPEIQKMAKSFEGHWNVLVTMEASAFGAADKGSGTEVTRSGPGGYSVISDSTLQFEHAGPFSGHGVMYFDPEAKTYTGFWCDSWSPSCMSVGTGNWEGDKIVMNSSMEMAGHTLNFRHIYSDFSNAGYKYTLEMADASGQMKPWMTFTYMRPSPAPPKAEPSKK